MATSNETIFNKRTLTSEPLLILHKIFCRRFTKIESNWLEISETGNAVCGHYYSAEILRDLMSSFVPVDFIRLCGLFSFTQLSAL